MAVHGDITDVTYNHPTLGSGRFLPKAAEGNTYDPGGIRNADDANMISGGGNLILKKNRVRGFVECVIEDDQNIQEDALTVAALAADPQAATWTWTMINGAVYQGEGWPVGDIQPNIDDGTMTLKVAVPTLEKILG